MLEKSEVMSKLTALSKKELLKMIEDLKIKPEECNLDTSTHGYALYKLDDIKKTKGEYRDPRQYYKMAFFSTVGFNPLVAVTSWTKVKVIKLMSKLRSTDPKDSDDAEIVADSGDFSRLYQIQNSEAITGTKALTMDLFSALSEYKESAGMYEYNIAFKKKEFTFDSASFSAKLLDQLLKRPNFSLRCNSEVSGLNYNTVTGVVESVRILGKSGKDVKCDAIVLCTGASTSRILYQTLGAFSPLLPVKGISFDFRTDATH